MTKTVSDKQTDHGISTKGGGVLNKQEGCVSLILRRKYLKVKNKQAEPVKHVLCLLDTFNVVWTMNLGITKIAVRQGYQRDYETKKNLYSGDTPANLLLTIRSSSFVISRGGTKAHFEGKIPEGYSDELVCTNDN